MSDLEDVRKTNERIKESHDPDVPGRETPLPPRESVQPQEDEEELPRHNLPRGSAGY
jgi:hypothetical protein